MSHGGRAAVAGEAWQLLLEFLLAARPHLPASTPIDWRDLESIDSPEDLNYSTLPGLLTTAGDPWADINESARDLAP